MMQKKKQGEVDRAGDENGPRAEEKVR